VLFLLRSVEKLENKNLRKCFYTEIIGDEISILFCEIQFAIIKILLLIVPDLISIGVYHILKFN
jgi:hypothetical protein